MFSADPFRQLKNLKMLSADPFGGLKNIQKCFRQIRSDSRKTCRKPGFSHDPAGSHSKRRAGCQSKRPAGSHSERSFVRSFLCSFVRSFVRLFVRWFVRSFIKLILHVGVEFLPEGLRLMYQQLSVMAVLSFGTGEKVAHFCSRLLF